MYVQFQNGLGYFDGAGWPNHLMTLIAVALTGIALALRPAPSLDQDAAKQVAK